VGGVHEGNQGCRTAAAMSSSAGNSQSSVSFADLVDDAGNQFAHQIVVRGRRRHCRLSVWGLSEFLTLRNGATPFILLCSRSGMETVRQLTPRVLVSGSDAVLNGSMTGANRKPHLYLWQGLGSTLGLLHAQAASSRLLFFEVLTRLRHSSEPPARRMSIMERLGSHI
jgi:hypothetical protein